MGYNQHKQCHLGEPKNHLHHLSLRIHRAESYQNHLDGQFILLWFVFNATYAQDFACLNVSEAASFLPFVSKSCDLKQNKDLTKLVWDDYPSSTVLSLLVFCEGVNSLMDKFPFTMLFYRKIIITICEGREIWI